MLSQDFALAELEVSGEFPNLASPMPSALVPRAKQLVARGLQPVRDQLGRPMRILSGYRSHALNRAVAVSYTHLTLPTTLHECRSRWSRYH